MSLREQGQVIRQLIQFARPYSRYFYGALAFSVFVSVINVLLPRVLQEFMNHHLQTASASLQILIVFASVYFVLTVVKAATQYFELYWFTSAAEFMFENVRVRLFKKLHGLGMRYFDQTPAGSLVSRMIPPLLPILAVILNVDDESIIDCVVVHCDVADQRSGNHGDGCFFPLLFLSV